LNRKSGGIEPNCDATVIIITGRRFGIPLIKYEFGIAKQRTRQTYKLIVDSSLQNHTSHTKDLKEQVINIYMKTIDPPWLRTVHHHHQPINVPTAGAQAFLMDYT
jgi:hypothetical protein